MAKSKKAGADNVLAPVAGIEMLAIHELVNSPTNPRKTYSVPELEELARSIRDHGLINPITVRPVYEENPSNKSLPPGILHYEVVAGNRRFKAAQIADMEFVPCIVRELTDDQVLDIQIDENLHRQDVPPLEEADAFKSLLDAKRISINELAARLNKSAAYIYKRIRLTNLSEKYRPYLQDGTLPVTVAEIISSYTIEAQDNAFKSVMYKEGEKVIFFDGKYVRRRMEMDLCTELKKAIWPLDAENMQPGLPACSACEKNTAVATLLFPDGLSNQRCTDKACWKVKERVFVAMAVQEWKAYCKAKKVEEVYADLYFFRYDQKSMEGIFDGTEKVLSQYNYEIVEEGTHGSIQVMFVGGSSWDEERNSRNYKTGWVTQKVSTNGTRTDWEMDKILQDSTLNQEEKQERITQLIAKREQQKKDQEIAAEQKSLRIIISSKAIEAKPLTTPNLMRLALYYQLIGYDNFLRDYWQDIFRLDAEEWRPDSFLKEHSENEEWNAATVDKWFSMLNGKDDGGIDPFDVWNDLLEDDEKFEFMNNTFNVSSDERISEILALTLLCKGHERLGDWNQKIPSEPLIRYGKTIGLDPDHILQFVRDERAKTPVVVDEDDDEMDYDLDDEDE